MLAMILALPLSCVIAACAPAIPPAEPLAASCKVTDGDTIRCGEERIRLLAIDAPEMGGRCRDGRDCVEGDPVAAADALRSAISGRALKIARSGEDRYGRTLAVVYADGANASCTMIAAGHAVYTRRWDRNGFVGRKCGLR